MDWDAWDDAEPSVSMSPLETFGRLMAESGIDAVNPELLESPVAGDILPELLYELAHEYVREYAGPFPFLQDMKKRAIHRGKPVERMTDRQAIGVLRCMMVEWSKQQREAMLAADRAAHAEIDREIAEADAYAQHVARQEQVLSREIFRELQADEAWRQELERQKTEHALGVNLAHIPDSTYTVVLSGEDDYVTLRLRSMDRKPDRLLGYLFGPNNDADYRVFGRVLPSGEVRIIHPHAVDGRIAEAVRVLAGAGSEQRAGMREQYAMRSGRCAVCGRTLTVPASLFRGVGPRCAKGLEG